jgi:uncharacterized protein (DUF697 family)/predicted GTPase
MHSFFKQVFTFINPDENDKIIKASEKWEEQLPTLWLLGKTGAGKSTLVQVITGDTKIKIGNGFRSCTRTASSYDYPQQNSILRFLDTRGLSEDNYNPTEDIEACQHKSHALVVVMKVDDVEQSDVVNAIKDIKKIGGIQHILIVHSNISSVSQRDREQSIYHNQHKIEEAWGEKINSVQVDFTDDKKMIGLEEFKNAILEILPMINAIIYDDEHISREEANFNELRTQIVWYAGSAGVSDLVPGVGIVSVPAIQGKMLHSLANQYGIEWNKQIFMEFMGVLGTGFALKYSTRFAIREAVKFIPIYGQSVGAGAAAVVSAASTYAIGRVACKYLYHKSRGETVSKKEMKELYKNALNKGKEVAQNETNSK